MQRWSWCRCRSAGTVAMTWMRFLGRSPMHWIYLTAAILCEVSGTTCMKLSQGFSRPWPTVLMYLFYLLSLNGLNLALRGMDVSVAYAIWAAMGTALVAAIGLLWFKEPLGALRIIALCFIVAGVVGLNLAGATHHEPTNSESPPCIDSPSLTANPGQAVRVACGAGASPHRD